MRFVLISHVLPPSPSGQAVILYRILSNINSKEYYLISSSPDQPGIDNMQNPFHLKASSYFLPNKQLTNKLNYFGIRHIHSIINLFIRVIIHTRTILKIIHNEPTQAIVACSGDLVDIPSGFLASRIAGLPFYAYIFDDFVFQWIGFERIIAKLFSSFIFRYSAGIIGPNEFICAEYQRRYGVPFTLVRNPCTNDELSMESISQWPTEKGRFQIIYTGSVYHANFDCFRNLIQAMEWLPEFNLELHIYTAQTQLQLENQGIKSKKVFIHSHILYSNILEQHRRADILFLPLAFNSSIPQVIRTSAPGKMSDYFTSGRPILAHVPADSFVAIYFKKHNCGSLCDQDNPSSLANSIKKIINDDVFRVNISKNARKCAKLDFSPEIAVTSFKNLLKINRTSHTTEN